MKDSISLYNKKILRLWRDSHGRIKDESWGKLFPMFYDIEWFEKFNKTENRILIVGCNPSFSKGKHKKRDIEASKTLLKITGTDKAIRDKIDRLHAFNQQRKGFVAKRRNIVMLQAAVLGLRIDQGVEAITYFNATMEFVLHLKSKFLKSFISNQIVCFAWAYVDLLAMRTRKKLKSSATMLSIIKRGSQLLTRRRTKIRISFSSKLNNF